MANPNKSPLKFWRKWYVGTTQQQRLSRDIHCYPETAQIFWLPPIISGTGKAMDFKFGGYIYRANPNKSPLKLLEKGDVGISRDIAQYFWVPPIISNFIGTFIGSIGTNAHDKCWE